MDNWINKHKTFLRIAIIVAAVFLYTAGLNNKLPIQEDSAIYVIFARSIAQGQGPLYTAGPVDIHLNYYPFLYPVMLSPLAALFPNNYLALKLLTLLCLALSVWVFFLIIKKIAQPAVVFWIMFLLIFNAQIRYYSLQVLSEIPYILFSLLAVYFLMRYQESRTPGGWYFYLSVLSALTAMQVRSIGISLLITAVCFFCLKKNLKKSILMGIALFITAGVWVIMNVVLTKTEYVQEFSVRTAGLSAFAWRCVYNTGAIIGTQLPDLFWYPFFFSMDPFSKVFWFKFYLGFTCAVLLVTGYVLKLKKEGLAIIDVYTLVYTLIMISWTHYNARYVLPILPFLLYYQIIAFQHLIRKKLILRLTLGLLLVVNITGSYLDLSRSRMAFYSPEKQSFIEAVDWIKGNVATDRLILSRFPSWLYVYSNGYRGAKFLATTDVEVQYQNIKQNKISYIIIDQNKIYRDDAKDYLFPLIRNFPNSFELVYTSRNEPKTWVYKVKEEI